MQSSLSTIHSIVHNLPAAARNDFEFWRERLEPLVCGGSHAGICASLKAIAISTGTPFKTLVRKYYAAKKNWPLALVDKRLAGPGWWRTSEQRAISDTDKELVRKYCEDNQRSSRSALKMLRRHWQRGQIKTQTPIDANTGFPRGWSVDNLVRYAPSKFELKAVRIGRSAAKTERPLVYTSRKGLWVGSHYMLDDMWHDFFVNTFSEKQAGRPLELFSHDLFSSRKVRWGVRVRTRKDDGKTYHALTGQMARMIVAATLYLDGYSPRGTVLVLEHGTATVPDSILDELRRLTDGLITASFSGMEGSITHAGQYPGISRGNFRHKASLESGNNLTHNVFAALPGQTGKDVEHRPEGLDSMLNNNRDLLAAASQLSPERAAMLSFPILELNQFHQIAAELYRAIDDDPDHDLNDWVECGHVINEILLGGQWLRADEVLKSREQTEFAQHLINAGSLQTRPRKMTRGEVWRAGAGDLIKIPGYGVCAILGDDLAVERKVRTNMFEFEDKEVGPGVHRYETEAVCSNGERIRLRDGEKYQTFVNPFAPETLFVRRANGAYIGECRRMEKPCRDDIEAVHRLCGARANEEAALLAPIRVRHLKDARDKSARHARNAAVLSGAPLTIDERNRRAALRDDQRQLTDDDRAAAIGSEASLLHRRDGILPSNHEAGSSTSHDDASSSSFPQISSEEISNIFASEPQTENNDPNPW